METRLQARIEDTETRMRAHTETVETRLLEEFWKWAKTADAGYRQNYMQVAGFEQRLIAVEDRIAELEREQ